MTFLLLIVLLIIATGSLVFKLNVKSSPRWQRFEGDYQIADPNFISPMTRVSLLDGDPDDDSDDDEEASSLFGDPLGDILGDVTRLSTSSDPNDFISGDIDDEYENANLQDSDFAEGGFFKNVAKKIGRGSKRFGKAALTGGLSEMINAVNKKKAKEKDKFGFKPNLVSTKAMTNAIRKDKDINKSINSLKEVSILAQTSGALTAKFDFSRVVVTGGEMRITQTNLKIPGHNLATAINIWQLNYPGLSRSSVQIAPVSGILSFPFIEPTAPEITTALSIFIMITAPLLKEIKGAEIGLTVTGTLTNGSVLTYNKDRIAIFTTDDRKTLIAVMPTVEIKQSLYVIPFQSPTTPLPITVAFTGLPEGSNVVVRLAGFDSAEFSSYKEMIGVK